MRTCLAIALAMILCSAARAAEVTLSLAPVTWPAFHPGDPYLSNKIDFHVVAHAVNPCGYPMIGFNFGLRHPADLVFEGASLVPSEWLLHIASADSVVSVVGYDAVNPPNQTPTVTLAFHNGAPGARTPCHGVIRIYDFQAGGALCGFTTEIAPYPCASPPSDIEPRPRTWSIVKTLYR